MYVAATDVLAALPLLTKGAELVASSAPKGESLVGMHTGNETLAILEVFSARCAGHRRFRTMGAILVTAALGVGFEVWAARFMRRKRWKRMHRWQEGNGDNPQVTGPFGAVAMRTTAHGLLGRVSVGSIALVLLVVEIYLHLGDGDLENKLRGDGVRLRTVGLSVGVGLAVEQLVDAVSGLVGAEHPDASRSRGYVGEVT